MKRLDVVRTPKGNIGVVAEVSNAGDRPFSLAFKSHRVQEKVAWWQDHEVKFLFNVADMVEVLDTDTIKELIRLRRKENG